MATTDEQIETGVDFDLAKIDLAIAVSLGWKRSYFVEKHRYRKENYDHILALLKPHSENSLVVEDKLISNEDVEDVTTDELELETPTTTEKVEYYAPPDEENFVPEATWRWLENSGIPQFTQNGEDLQLLMGAIHKESLRIEVYSFNGIITSTLTNSNYPSISATTKIEGTNLNLALCLCWLEYYEIKI